MTITHTKKLSHEYRVLFKNRWLWSNSPFKMTVTHTKKNSHESRVPFCMIFTSAIKFPNIKPI
jgi:hypothetical protein